MTWSAGKDACAPRFHLVTSKDIDLDREGFLPIDRQHQIYLSVGNAKQSARDADVDLVEADEAACAPAYKTSAG